MRFIDNLFLFLKKFFYKKSNIKMIELPSSDRFLDEIQSFKTSLKVTLSEKSKKRVETLTCFGDGLGIQTKIKY